MATEKCMFIRMGSVACRSTKRYGCRVSAFERLVERAVGQGFEMVSVA